MSSYTHYLLSFFICCAIGINYGGLFAQTQSQLTNINYNDIPLAGNPVPVNDLCSNAEEISCGDTKTGSIAASTNTDAPSGCGLTSDVGVWYHFTGTGDYVSFSTCNGATNYNAQVEVYSGDCNSLVCVSGADSDPNCSDYFHASAGFCSEADTDYFIYVTKSFGSTGTYELSATCQSEPPEIEIEARGGSLVFCGNNNSVELHATLGASSYLWTPGNETGSSLFATDTGTYTVTGDFNGCTSSATVTVEGLDAIITTQIDTACEGDPPLILQGDGTFGGAFSGNGITNSGSTSASATGLPIAIPDNSPTGATSTITPNGVPGTAMGTDVSLSKVCLAVDHAWLGDLTLILTSPNGTEVTLYNRPGVPESSSGCSLDNFSFTFIPGTGNDAENFCNNDANGIFTAHDGDDINDLNDGSDPNGTWTLTLIDSADQNTGTLESFSLGFETNGMFDPGAAGPGVHTVTFEIQSCENECSTSVTKIIEVLQGPTAVLSGGGTACEGDSVQLNVDFTGTPPWTFEYSRDLSEPFLLGPTLLPSGYFKVTESGTYYAVSVMDATGCPGVATGEVSVTFNDTPSVSVLPYPTDVLCQDSTISTITNVSGGTAPYTYQWASGQTTSTILIDAPGSYCIMVTDANNCKSDTCIEIHDGGSGPENCDFTYDASNSPTISFSATASGYIGEWAWNFDDNSGLQYGQNMSHTFTSPGTYNVNVFVSNDCGYCDKTVSITINSVDIIEHIVSDLEIFPNPTNDVVTILFSVNQTEAIDLQLKNMLGQIVYNETMSGVSGDFTKPLDLNSYSKGSYILQIATDSEVLTRKIIKK